MTTEKKTDAKSEPAAKADDAPKPVVDLSMNPEGIDLSKGDKDAATAYEPEEK